MPRQVDYALARRRVLRDFRRGKLSRLDVCDAHPELLRAAKNVGDPTEVTCPVCAKGPVRIVSYVYGNNLRAANGRCITLPNELDRLGEAHDEFTRYMVEVCVECHWNHLLSSSLLGRRHAG